jgi:II/X family phage/plasmid replication protein
MIDWITCTVPLAHNPIPSGTFLSITVDGEIEYEVSKRVSIEGSFKSSVQIKSDGPLTKNGMATLLVVSGNPSKFIQGHNIFGVNDVCLLITKLIRKISHLLSFPDSLLDLFSIKISRIDICESFIFRSRLEANQYIRQVALLSSARVGRPVMAGQTCYYGKNSRRWSIKYYCKGDEIEKHKLPLDIQFREKLIDEADKLVRCEVTLRSLVLKDNNLHLASSWNEDVVLKAYSDYLRKINMSSQIKIESEALSCMPRCFRDTFFRWKSGIDVRIHMSKATFYKHRSYLLSYGVDISIPNPDATLSSAEVIPFYKVLEPKPYKIPDWAYGTDLLVS